MGYYIEVPNHKNKSAQIETLYGATLTKMPTCLSDLPDDKALVVVVGNPQFDAITYCYSDDELYAFNDPRDIRAKAWYLMDKEKAQELSGYTRNQ